MVSGLDFITMVIAPMLLDMPKQLLPTYTQTWLQSLHSILYSPFVSSFKWTGGETKQPKPAENCIPWVSWLDYTGHMKCLSRGIHSVRVQRSMQYQHYC